MPDPFEFEVTLLGTGGGYGESVVIHIGSNEWIIVDSCENPNDGSVLPLEYLKSIGVDIRKQVKLVVCTHWHDDHIKGLHKILEECSSSMFCFSKVLDRKKFLRFVGLDSNKLREKGVLSSTKEFSSCLETMETSQRRMLSASPDRLIYKKEISDKIYSEVFTLSPSDFAINNFDLEISKLISDFGDFRKKIIIQQPNDKSVVLLLKLGDHRVLLGADLEVNSLSNSGWFAIINESTIIKDNKSSYFKIPHHGSENGYHLDIWENLIEKKSLATLTPWNRNEKLPKDEMLVKYKSHSPDLYITSPIINNKNPKKRDKEIEKIIQKFDIKLREVKFSMGIIRSRIKLSDSEWTTQVFGSAFKL